MKNKDSASKKRTHSVAFENLDGDKKEIKAPKKKRVTLNSMTPESRTKIIKSAPKLSPRKKESEKV